MEHREVPIDLLVHAVLDAPAGRLGLRRIERVERGPTRADSALRTLAAIAALHRESEVAGNRNARHACGGMGLAASARSDRRRLVRRGVRVGHEARPRKSR